VSGAWQQGCVEAPGSGSWSVRHQAGTGVVAVVAAPAIGADEVHVDRRRSYS